MLKNFFIVFAGGGLGAALRLLIYFIIPNNHFPYATFFVNIIGSILIGLIFGVSARSAYFSEEMKIFLVTGICGGFTTFSAFSAENLGLLQQGKYFTVTIYIIASVSLALGGTWIGYKIST